MLKHRFIMISLAIVVMCALMLGACAKPEPTTPSTPSTPSTPAQPEKTDPVVLKGVGNYSSPGFTNTEKLIAEKLAEKSGGLVTINWIGAGEAIPPADQQAACRDGVVDILMAAFGSYEKLIPESIAVPLSDYTPAEDLDNGIYDYWVDKFKNEMNSRYLGISYCPGKYYLFTQFPVSKPDDLKGHKLRGSNSFAPFLKALGVTPVFTPTGESYGALQTGTVEGTGLVTDSFIGMKLYEVTDYYINHGFYRVNSVLVMNQDKFDSLPKQYQDWIIETNNEQIAERWPDLAGLDEKMFGIMRDNGMEEVKFSAEDAKWYVDTANDAKWQELKDAVGEEEFNKVKGLFTK